MIPDKQRGKRLSRKKEQAMRDYPVGKAQQTILTSLNLTATGHSDAERIFNELGIIVATRRQGRKSVPVVTLRDTEIGGFTADGDGWSAPVEYANVDLDKISQWMA
jgi:glutaredoxin